MNSFLFSIYFVVLVLDCLPPLEAYEEIHIKFNLNSSKFSNFPNQQSRELFELFAGSNSSAVDPTKALIRDKAKVLMLNESDLNIVSLIQSAGFYILPNTKGAARMFYFFFKSEGNESDPVILWLNGGPGSSGGSIALFYENGPFHIKEDHSLIQNHHSWHKVSNIIYVDQPIGTGFSSTAYDSNLRHDQITASRDLYNFLQLFFNDLEHHQFRKNKFFIIGQSHAGQSIPPLALRIHNANKERTGIHINLHGIAIGNGLTNPGIQFKSYPDYVLRRSLTKDSYERHVIYSMAEKCVSLINTCDHKGNEDDCLIAYSNCMNTIVYICNTLQIKNFYDVREECDNSKYDFTPVKELLNVPELKDAMEVGDIEFVLNSDAVKSAMKADMMKNRNTGISDLLNSGIRVLIYAGVEDLLCNWIGNEWWVRDLVWTGKESFVTSQFVPFFVNNVNSGALKNYGPLSFLKVYRAGHLVPMDQPEVALEMIKRWMGRELSTPH